MIINWMKGVEFSCESPSLLCIVLYYLSQIREVKAHIAIEEVKC
jgi:hypothetical protein